MTMPYTSVSVLHRVVRSNWDQICKQAKANGAKGKRPSLPGVQLRLLGTSIKVEKGRGRGWETSIMYLAPATEASNKSICPDSTPECRAACLGHSSGRLAFGTAKNARAWKTWLYLGDPTLFQSLLLLECAAFERRAAKHGKRCAIRLNGSSDIDWRGIVEMANRHGFGKHIQFYDYSKNMYLPMGDRPINYHVTYSYDGYNGIQYQSLLAEGGNVAVAFATRSVDDFPLTCWGFRVINADETDLRFLDAPGTVAGLTLKGIRATDVILRRARSFAMPCDVS